MLRKTILAASAAMLFSATAYAGNCPNIMAAIDAAMPSSTLSAADKDKVMKLRKNGEAEHKAGKHAASVATLSQAKAMLGLN